MRKTTVFAFVAVVGAVLQGAACSSSPSGGFNPEDAGQDVTALDGPGFIEDTGTADGSVADAPIVFNDAALDVEASCSFDDDGGGPGPIQHLCLPPTNNECDGQHDIATYPSNGTSGNGFDDDCDGQVDEGCSCPAPGVTKECFLVPASQTFGGKPVGWCAQNSRGTMECNKPSAEFAGSWSGACRGAQPPYADDICAVGDFNCDGKDKNSATQNCSCGPAAIQCPTDSVKTIPYPPPSALPLKIDAANWFQNPAALPQATNWKWSVIGGDCDNVMPHPTFGIYATANGSGDPLGTQSVTLGASGKEHGMVATAPAVTSSFYPAFSLSGDYLVTAEWDIQNKHFTCTQKVEVRAPGIRAEACWDTEGTVDLDLHMAKLDGFSTCAQKGWEKTCSTTAPAMTEDCYYGNCKDTPGPAWYAPSTAVACSGWGSQNSGSSCGNPRLDRDNISCDSGETNPNNAETFCGPENINIDTPADGSRYAVAVKYYGFDAQSHPHVNVYCNGERVISTGFNPVTGINFPLMTTSGGNDAGDMWKVGLITAHVSGGTLTCDVKPTQAVHPRAATDGPGYCVDTSATDGADSVHLFATGGALPLDENAICFH